MDLRAVWAQMKWSRVLLALFIFAVFWNVSIFLAPATIAPGSFAYVEGRANAVDHWDIYAGPEFNWYAKVIYVLGDAECHQLWYRSLWINGNQMPVDARDVSIYMFGMFGLFWAMMTPAAATISSGIVNAFPMRVRRWAARVGPAPFAFFVIVLGLMPVAVDGFTQLLTPYESNNLTRVLTGISCGLVAGLLVGMIVKAIRQTNLEVKELRSRADVEALREAKG